MKPQNLGHWLMKSSQSNLNLRSPSSYLVRSYQITTVIPQVNLKILLDDVNKLLKTKSFLTTPGFTPQANFLAHNLHFH